MSNSFGLQLVQSQHLQHVLIDFDSKVAVDIIQCGYINISYLQLVLGDIIYILYTLNMNLELHHIIRDTNEYVDLLAHHIKHFYL